MEGRTLLGMCRDPLAEGNMLRKSQRGWNRKKKKHGTRHLGTQTLKMTVELFWIEVTVAQEQSRVRSHRPFRPCKKCWSLF